MSGTIEASSQAVQAFHTKFTQMMEARGVQVVADERGVPTIAQRIDPEQAKLGVQALPAARLANGRPLP